MFKVSPYSGTYYVPVLGVERNMWETPVLWSLPLITVWQSHHDDDNDGDGDGDHHDDGGSDEFDGGDGRDMMMMMMVMVIIIMMVVMSILAMWCLPWAKHLSDISLFNFCESKMDNTIIIPALQMRKVRCREVK